MTTVKFIPPVFIVVGPNGYLDPFQIEYLVIGGSILFVRKSAGHRVFDRRAVESDASILVDTSPGILDRCVSIMKRGSLASMSPFVILKLATFGLWGAIGAVVVLLLRIRRKKDFAFLFFFSVFSLYLLAVLDLTVFEFQSLVVLKLFMPSLILNGQEAAKSLNLVPLVGLTAADLGTSLLNVLLFVPFGFGIRFITRFHFSRVLAVGSALSVSIEVVQFATGYFSGVSFRVADINDVIFNSLGVCLGFALCSMALGLYRSLYRGWQTSRAPLLKYISTIEAMKAYRTRVE